MVDEVEDGVRVERVDEVEDEVDALEVVPAQRYCGIQTHQEHVTSLGARSCQFEQYAPITIFCGVCMNEHA